MECRRMECLIAEGRTEWPEKFRTGCVRRGALQHRDGLTSCQRWGVPIWWWAVVMVVAVSLGPQPVSCFQPEKMYLNSYVHCGHGDARELWYAVDRTSLFNIQDDVTPHAGTHAFRDCELVFRSTRRDGHLCLFQRHLVFDSCDVELKLYDGWKDVDGVKEPNKTLSCNTGLTSVEWCTSGRYLTVRMSQAGKKPSVRDVNIDLLVYDMRSIHRKVSMDSLPSCGSRLLMDESQVNVTNLNPRVKVGDIFPQCTLTFEYIGHRENRTMCTVFLPVGGMAGCKELNYTLTIHEFRPLLATGMSVGWNSVPQSSRNTLGERVVSSIRSCDNPYPTRWCSNSTEISLELHWTIPPTATRDQPHRLAFYALVMDHEGGAETLPVPQASVSKEEEDDILVICGLIVGSIVLLCVFSCFLLFIYRRYRQSRDDKSTADSGASTSMLDNPANGHSKANGQNHYLEGTPSQQTAQQPAFV